MTETIVLSTNSNGHDCINDHDLAVLADWASKQKLQTPNSDWKRAFGLIREGADLLLRRRARSKDFPDPATTPKEGVPICK
jgi:hypothetical protein